MTVAEFEGEYYLHDSCLEKIEFDFSNRQLTLTIDFCFWMQNWYDKETPENGLIAVTFNNVSDYSYENYDPSKQFSDHTPEILQTKVNEDSTFEMFTFEFVRYEPGEDLYPVLKVKADSVTVTDLKQRTDID